MLLPSSITRGVVLLLWWCFCLSPTTQALVSVPHRLPVQTLSRRRPELQQQVYLETSPLIGGPSWLPLHVTVVLACITSTSTSSSSNNNNAAQPPTQQLRTEHRYDLIPQHPTDPQTLRTLLTFGTVPARVRYRTSTKEQVAPTVEDDHDDAIPVGVLPDFGLVLMDDDTDTDTEPVDDDDGKAAAAVLLTTTATMFCARYPAELQLIRQNCWSFAWELYDVLLEEQARQAEEQEQQQSRGQ